MRFEVIDKQTENRPDTEKIVKFETWATHLYSMDIDGFAIQEDGTLILMDDMNNIAYCPEGRFQIVYHGARNDLNPTNYIDTIRHLKDELAVKDKRALDMVVGERDIINPKGEKIMNKDIKKRFTYYTPKAGQPERYQEIRGSALDLAEVFNKECPDSREKSLAMTKLEEAVFWANASIARNE